MTIKRMRPGVRTSAINIYNNTVYLAGQVGQGETVAEQTRDILNTIDQRLAEAGTDKSKILQALVWVADIATVDEMNAVWDEWVDKANMPARATGEARLVAPRKVEIIVTAAVE